MKLERECIGVSQALQREQALRKATAARAREATASLSQKVSELEASLTANTVATAERNSRAQQAPKVVRKVDVATSPRPHKPKPRAKRLPLRNLTDLDGTQCDKPGQDVEPEGLKHKSCSTRPGVRSSKSRVTKARRVPSRTNKAEIEKKKRSGKVTSTKLKARSTKPTAGNRQHHHSAHAFGRAICISDKQLSEL